MYDIISLNPSLVIFDMDGLIFDTEQLFMHYLTINNKKYGYVITREMYIDTLGLAGEKLHTKMFGYFGDDYPIVEISHKTRDDLRDHIKEKGIPVKPGIPELLDYISSNNVPCAIASSSQSKYVKEYIEAAHLDKYFNFIIGGEMVKNSKPSPDIFLLAANKANIAPAKCVVLEDSENGIRAAHSAGMKAICIPDLKYPQEEVKNLTTLIVDDAFELIKK